MTSSYAHVMDRQATLHNRLESPITANQDHLQAKKNFSVSHLLDLEEAREMVGAQAEESAGEAGRSMLESPGLTSGSDTTQQESKSSAKHDPHVPSTLLMAQKYLKHLSVRIIMIFPNLVRNYYSYSNLYRGKKVGNSV